MVNPRDIAGERKKKKKKKKKKVCFVLVLFLGVFVFVLLFLNACLSLEVPAKNKVTNLPKEWNVLPHCDKSCRADLPYNIVTA